MRIDERRIKKSAKSRKITEFLLFWLHYVTYENAT